MAFDGIVLATLVQELKDTLVGGRIDKIYQIEKDELLLSVRNNSSAYKLLLAANSSYPRLHLSTLSKNNELQPPMFCMMLRKHLGGGRILDIVQPDFERIVELHIEATNELGDKENKRLIIEIMGRHSNIILTKADGTILDSIKHISLDKSSVREVLPNRTYVRPPSQNKRNPLHENVADFLKTLKEKELPTFKALYMSYNGLSPVVSHSICLASGVCDDSLANTLSNDDLMKLYTVFHNLMEKLHTNNFSPCIYLDEQELPMDFYTLPLSIYAPYKKQNFETISEMLEYYYFEKNTRFNVSQKTADIKKLVHNFLERNVRKKQIQEKALDEAANKELYKIYGELLTAYAHSITEGSESFTTMNYYAEPYEDITIPLNPRKSAIQNAQAYFKLYNKAKRTEIAATEQLAIIEEDIAYLQSVLLSLDFLETKEDIAELREELVEMGYLKKRKGNNKRKQNKKTVPFLQFKASSGQLIYVGKNNYQNDELTMKFAKANDMWLHIKAGPGSHVIIRAEGQEGFSDETLLEAATLAAYYSSGKQSSQVPIDYTLKKFVKTVPGAKPAMVIYTQFKTLYVTPTESFIKKLTLEEKK